MVPDVSGSRKSRSEPPSERLELAVGDSRSCSIQRGTCSNFTVCCSAGPLRLLIARPYMLEPWFFPTRSFLVSRSSSPSIADELRYHHVHTTTTTTTTTSQQQPGYPTRRTQCRVACSPRTTCRTQSRLNLNSFQLDTQLFTPFTPPAYIHLQGVNREKQNI
jgi:hypothetical protein